MGKKTSQQGERGCSQDSSSGVGGEEGGDAFWRRTGGGKAFFFGVKKKGDFFSEGPKTTPRGIRHELFCTLEKGTFKERGEPRPAT